MSHLSKLSLVKLHLEKVKEKSTSRFSSFTSHLIQKYSLDSLLEKEQNKVPLNLQPEGGKI